MREKYCPKKTTNTKDTKQKCSKDMRTGATPGDIRFNVHGNIAQQYNPKD